MKYIWIIMEDVDDYPESGGGEFFYRAYANKTDADAYREKLTKNTIDERISYYVEKVILY